MTLVKYLVFVLASSFLTLLPGVFGGRAGAQSSGSTAAPRAAGGKALVVYFTQTGNTETVAGMISERTGAPLFRLLTVKPYPDTYDECVKVARIEQNENARPELANRVDNLADYDVVYLGFPNWWGTIPMALFTFLEQNDFSGKTIVPFCTHNGSAMGRSERDIASLAPGARVLRGLPVRGSRSSGAADAVEKWLAGLDLS
ncbi:MAG: flavodoxin [Deltaproteobacteria bacterium]|jgi:flavodoxin|nr:flavodoxin [Deltaproteobacteria bacterium]